MGKVGFMQDLMRGIGKIIPLQSQTVQNTVVVQQTSVNPQANSLLERAFMFLEEKQWSKANEYLEKVLDLEPKNARAYVGKLLADYYITTKEELHFSKSSNVDKLFTAPIENNQFYKKALRFADTDMKRELEKDAADNAEEKIRRRYEAAKEKIRKAVSDPDYNDTAVLFDRILSYRDSAQLAAQCRENAKECLYKQTLSKMDTALSEEQFRIIAKKFEEFGNYRDSSKFARQCIDNAEFCRNNLILRIITCKKD